MLPIYLCQKLQFCSEDFIILIFVSIMGRGKRVNVELGISLQFVWIEWKLCSGKTGTH